MQKTRSASTIPSVLARSWSWPMAMMGLVLVALLAGCGGGGGGAGEPTPAGPVSYSIGGQLAGLGAGKNVTLAQVDAAGATAQSAVLDANGAYSLRLPPGTAYNLRVLTQPAGQTCTVTNGAGTASADVNNIAVSCQDNPLAPDAKVIAGTVAGLAAGKTLVLELTVNGTAQQATVNADGSFQFPQAITGTYAITVKTAPTGQGCTVAGAQGAAGDAAAISVTCADVTFRLGGTIAGNLGGVVLRNTVNGDTLTLSGNGVFTLTQPVVPAGSYAVVLIDQSAGQSCSVANAAGAASADVSNIAVSCTADVVAAPAVLAPSVPSGLTMTYGIKSFNLAWGAVAAPAGGGPVSYRLFEDPDGAGPAAAAQIGGTLTTSTYTYVVAGLLHTRLNAQYSVQACNSGGCSTPTAAITPNLTQAIGYFKASNTQANDRFGYSVALSSDGSTLAVGAPREDSSATGLNGNQADNSAAESGAVYVFSRTGASWVQQAYVKASNTGASNQFGWSIALSADGNTLAVGATGEDSSAIGMNGNEADNSALQSGAVYVFSRTGANWVQQAYVKASNTQANDWFGYSVALSGDGNTLAVGATREASNATGLNGTQADNSAMNSGAVYVFSRTGASWAQQAYVKASNTQANDWFGYSVALSGDGSTLAVGAFMEGSSAIGLNGNEADNSAADSGAVYVFSRTGASWAQQAYVKASNTQADDRFGYSVALSSDGSTLAVGAPREDSSATGLNGNQADNSAIDSGAVYVFGRTGASWVQQAYVKASSTKPAGNFGNSVALSDDGNTLAAGAMWEASNATGLNGNEADNSALQSGAVYVFSRTGASWAQQAYVKASNTQAVDWFGYSVALSGDGNTLAVGAYREASNVTGLNGNQVDNSATESGAVYVY